MSIAIGLLLMIVFGALMSLAWSLLAAGLRVPVSFPSSAPLVIAAASVFASCAFVARRTGRWWNGVLMALVIVLLNWCGWVFVSSRFRLPDAFTVGIFGVGGRQLLWWVALLLFGTFAALVGTGFRLRPPRIGSRQPSSAPLILVAWFLGLLVCVAAASAQRSLDRNTWVFQSADNSPLILSRYFQQIRSKQSSDVVGANHMRAMSETDGTQFDLFLFDMRWGLKAGLYDLDQHDSNPGDNRNYSFHGFNAARSLPAIERAAGIDKPRRVLAVINGGAFDPGAGSSWPAKHLSSVIYRGGVCYVVDRPAWTLALRGAGDLKMSLSYARTAHDLPRTASYGICDVQALLAGGRSVPGRPMPRQDVLETSRTSIGWDGKSRLYVLIVHDPDGEADSLRQTVSGAQTGGWDLAHLRTFWRDMGVPYAVNLAGGDSSQMVYQWRRNLRRGARLIPGSGYAFIPSNEFAVTVAYWNDRPVRMAIPTVPTHVMSRGSLNYIYLWR